VTAPKTILQHSPPKPSTIVLQAIGDRELPDAHPSESQRRVLKDLARSLGPRFSSRELAYLASAVEAEASAKRAAEEEGVTP
jgi:hypothetical protein